MNNLQTYEQDLRTEEDVVNTNLVMVIQDEIQKKQEKRLLSIIITNYHDPLKAADVTYN